MGALFSNFRSLPTLSDASVAPMTFSAFLTFAVVTFRQVVFLLSFSLLFCTRGHLDDKNVLHPIGDE